MYAVHAIDHITTTYMMGLVNPLGLSILYAKISYAYLVSYVYTLHSCCYIEALHISKVSQFLAISASDISKQWTNCTNQADCNTSFLIHVLKQFDRLKFAQGQTLQAGNLISIISTTKTITYVKCGTTRTRS